MSTVESSTSIDSPGSDKQSEQLRLPIDVRSNETVHWYKAKRIVKQNWPFWDRIITSYLFREDGMVQDEEIEVEKISELNDPELRYALRFAAAAQAVGEHTVWVTATDEGYASRWISAGYTGLVKEGVDTFMDSLRSQRPAEHPTDISEVG